MSPITFKCIKTVRFVKITIKLPFSVINTSDFIGNIQSEAMISPVSRLGCLWKHSKRRFLVTFKFSFSTLHPILQVVHAHIGKSSDLSVFLCIGLILSIVVVKFLLFTMRWIPAKIICVSLVMFHAFLFAGKWNLIHFSIRSPDHIFNGLKSSL